MPSVNNGDVSIYYEDFGDGEDTIVFAHGAGGNAASWWQQIPCFTEKYRVIALDHRNFARSPCSPAQMDVKYFAGDLRALLDQEHIERAFLVCQSMGGWTGLSFALESPERVRGLIMSHTPGGISSSEMIQIRDSASAGLKPLTDRFAHWALAPDFHVTSPELANLYNQLSNFNTQFDLANVLASMWEPVPSEDLAALDLPVLFITAERDQIFPVAFIRLAAAQVPGASVKVLGKAGHSSYFESAELFNRTVDEFLDQCISEGR